MLGLAVLFGLAVWVAITIGAVFLGSKGLNMWWPKPYAGLLGGFLGFMLTMGGFIVYWAVEYIQIQRAVTHLCETEGGITVYVTPEEWRKQIGEEEWKNLAVYTKNDIQLSDYNKKKIKIDGLVFEYSKGNTHIKEGILENNRVAFYNSYEIKNPMYGSKSISMIVEKGAHKILLKNVSFFYGAGSVENNLSGLKFWLDNIKSCNYTKEFIKTARKYSNNKDVGISNE